LPVGHDQEDRSETDAPVGGSHADDATGAPVVILGRARLHMAKK
jgi:hypothetical protein